jgi:pimeloyl-ACP methyl ester carboxylesterase
MVQNLLRKSIAASILFMFVASGLSSQVRCSASALCAPSLAQEIYHVRTSDGSSITLTRYAGEKRPSLMLVHGMCCNHLFLDWDQNHSIARFLAADGWDVWMLDLRTHDGDGDFWFGHLRGLNSSREYINRFWDLDRTYLKIDVATAVKFIKEHAGTDKIVFMGHSMGGYLAYMYAETMNQDDLAGIVALSSSAKANGFVDKWMTDFRFGFRVGKRAFVHPLFGSPYLHISKFYIDKTLDLNRPGYYYGNTTSKAVRDAISYHRDDEPAGVWVDMMQGRDPRYYGDDWVDPQTLFDYTAHLSRIRVPFLAIAGDQDTSDPKDDIFYCYQHVSSTMKTFVNISSYGHMDVILGDDASVRVFPHITAWLDALPR